MRISDVSASWDMAMIKSSPFMLCLKFKEIITPPILSFLIEIFPNTLSAYKCNLSNKTGPIL